MLLYPATIKRETAILFTLIFLDVPGAHTNGGSREARWRMPRTHCTPPSRC